MLDGQPEKSQTNWLQKMTERDPGFEDSAVSEFSDRLIRLAKSRMSHKLHRRVDPEDIVQSVFRSFFRRHEENKFEFSESNDVWRLLAAITYKKTLQTNRFHHQLIRDVRLEDNSDSENQDSTPKNGDPTASSIALMNDLLESILSRLPETHHRILLLRLEQFSIEEIAAQTNLSTRTVDRTLKLVRSIAEELCPD